MSAAIEERLRNMESRLALIEAERDEYQRERDEYRKLYELSREEVERLKRGLLGRKAERSPPGVQQLSLQILGEVLGQRTDAEAAAKDNDELVVEQPVKAHVRRKRVGRKPLPEHLLQVRIVIVPDEVQREGLDAFEQIGEETSETLEKRRASPVRVLTVRPKFVRKDRKRRGKTRVLIASPPVMPIPRGLAGPGLLADTIVKRWADHLPLHRQEQIWAREGVELSRSTICGWHDTLSELVQSLVDAMFADAYTSPYLCTDATGVLVQAKGACRTGHFWVLVAPDKHVLFRFSQSHNGKAVDALLESYEGYLVADAHAVYDHLYADGGVVEVGCWSHCRRYFFKSLPSDPERAQVALRLIGQLFRIEEKLRKSKASRKKIERIRAAKSRRIVDGFFAWCRQEGLDVLDDTPIAKGIGYALNQETALRRFLDDGRLPIHNNRSELELRRQAVGRKNWLFVGSKDGAVANSRFVSLIASCQLHGIEPWAYLRDLFCLLPHWPEADVLRLAPAYWRETSARNDVQALLEQNVFRRAIEIADAVTTDSS